MKILYVASEALPFASTGGLADVMGSLPAAVRKAAGGEADVRVVIPMYKNIKRRAMEMDSGFDFVLEGTVRLAWRNQYCGIWKTERGGVKYYFIDNEYYFSRNMMYGNYDDGERFAYFGRAVLFLMSAVGFIPDIMHANDWQSAPAVIYLKRCLGEEPEWRDVRVLMTIHNIEYQGKYDQAILGDVFGLSEADRSTVEYNGCINLLKGAIVCADMVSTVSERYADELLTEYYSCGLHYILRERRDCLCGIVNGIDTSYYDPETDPDIVRNYSAKDCSFKSENKTELQRICGIDTDPSKPLMIMVTRLASHKGVELVSRVFSDLMRDTDLTFAVLGTGEAQYEDFFRRAAVDYPGRVGVHLTYDKALSKKYYAGGDMFLMPSKSEPCGLSQMIAARYGTVPIVRETGGLVDTIRPYNEFTGDGNGFSFTNYNAHEMMETIKYALKQYGIKKQWNALMRRAMNTDFSWGASAEKYLALYRRML